MERIKGELLFLIELWKTDLSLAREYRASFISQATNAILTLAQYPRDIFQGVVRFLMLTILPAAFVGAITLDIVRRLDWTALLGLMGFAVGITLLLRIVFYAGLRRYVWGSAINVNV